MSFSSLGLSPALLRAVDAKGYTTPTPVQSASIPAALAGRDVLGAAQTGSGKTAAFALPILQRLERSPATKPRRVKALILVPTRELAAQVGEMFCNFAAHLPHPPHLASALKITTVFGGVSINPQMLGLRGGTDIVVATPGRLLDLIDHNAVHLDSVETLVLDEADRLLDLGFADELDRILSLLPKARQNLFFSATFPPAVERLASELLRDPLRVALSSTTDPAPEITQRAILIDTGRRTQLLRHLIDQHAWKRALVFVATKHASEMVAEKLRNARINAEPFHSELSQGKRTQVLADFKASRLRVVVATDVASRGIDIAQMPVVVNYDLPRSPDDYTQRIGRTARAGESGIAVSFVSPSTEAHFWLIQKRNRIEVAIEQIEGFEVTDFAPIDGRPVGAAGATPASTANGGIKGKRPNKKDKLRAALAASQ
jgi:ATP-dependent RNA helicase RhlE